MNSLEQLKQKADSTADKYFPIALDAESRIILRRVSLQQYYDLTLKLRDNLFPDNVDTLSPESRDPLTPHAIEQRDSLSSHFFGRHTEAFIVEKSGSPIGWLQGEMLDYETFYFRNAAILSGFFLRRVEIIVINFLRELGYFRFTGHQHGANKTILLRVIKDGFYIVGMELDERWGFNVKTLLVTDLTRRKMLTQKLGQIPSKGGQVHQTLQGDSIIVYPPVNFDDVLYAGLIANGWISRMSNQGYRYLIIYLRPQDRSALVTAIKKGFEIFAFESDPRNGAWLRLRKPLSEGVETVISDTGPP